MKKLIVGLAVALGVVVPSGTTSAGPINCRVYYIGDIGWSECGGSGQHRVVLGCWVPSIHTYVTKKGPWSSTRDISPAQCPEGQSPSTGWVSKR